MAECKELGQSWPEQDAAERWWINNRQSLKEEVTRFRIEETQRLNDVIDKLRSALEGWMLDHGERCRICMERSQEAIKFSDSTRR